MGSKKKDARAADRVRNPCIGVCKIDKATGWCRGCWRTKSEIREWKHATDAERARLAQVIELRRSAAPPDDASIPLQPSSASPGEASARAPLPAATGPAPLRRYRHRKTGGLYTELHRGLLEADLTPVVIYLAEDGRVWVRPAAQFDDGRFEPA